ncbi:MAG: MarR family winged helix-turn-helix transcriptional regulator, partial [Paracoccaceae bacterium]
MITDRAGFHVRRQQQIWSAQIQRMFRDAGHDMTSVQFAALELVADHPGRDQTDLALRIGYDRATTGGVVARLERMGYLHRRPAPGDRRSRSLAATAQGRAALAELRAPARRADEA